ncbi:MAG TPA: hypothetical protein VM432_13375 [Bdellovibrionales bacterium]|nr:hypothetical protein [Bdellovibrionales bacterium]
MKKLAYLPLAVALMTGCGSNSSSFSLLPSEANFEQAALTKNKIDILWVVDNSGSMDSSQQALATNIARFIELFNKRGFDYSMAVSTSDAYKELFGAGQNQSRFKDGTDSTSHTGYHVVTRNTPNLVSTFSTNVLQGIMGSGDERAFQSIKQALENPDNAAVFPRPGAFLAVIILSDEDDYSHDGSNSIAGDYSNPGLHSIASYVSYLDGLTGADASTRAQKYSVNSIAILDQQCLDTLNAETPGRRIGIRYVELAEATNGIVGDLCGNFGQTLADISAYILNAVTEFFLDREPNVSTIRAYIDGKRVPRIESPSGDGFIYHADRNSITFHGKWQPQASQDVKVTFDPTSIR